MMPYPCSLKFLAAVAMSGSRSEENKNVNTKYVYKNSCIFSTYISAPKDVRGVKKTKNTKYVSRTCYFSALIFS